LFLAYAWQARLELHDLVQKVASSCRQFKVDRLLIENKAAGYSVSQELRRLYGHEDWAVQLVDPKGQDKLARLYSISHLFEEGLVHAPNMKWAEEVITQVSQFPKGKHDDLVDTVSMGVKYLRDTGILVRQPEWAADLDESRKHLGKAPAPLYPV
jgi:predicted phage terminase large subunit-like protein